MGFLTLRNRQLSSAPTLTSDVSSSNQSPAADMVNISYLLFIAIGLVLGVVTFLVAFVMCRRKARRTNDSTTAAKVDIESTMVPQMTETDVTQNTAIVTTHELAVPAFMEVSYGLDYTLGKQIARGGMGEIRHATAIGRPLMSRIGKNGIIAKVSDDAVQFMKQEYKNVYF